MVHSASLGEINLITRKHLIAQLLNARLLGELDQQRQRLIVEEVLAEVEQDLRLVGVVLEDVRVLLEPLGVGLEVVA